MTAIKTVCVIGAGVMGHAIAFVHALGGNKVRLYNRNKERLDWAEKRVTELSVEVVELNLATQQQAEDCLNNLTFVSALSNALDSVDLVVEAIAEEPEAKRALFLKLEALAPKDALIASNTSYLDVFPLMPDSLADRSLILHWYTPPYLVDLVDVVPGSELPQERLAAVINLLTSFGKHPVVLKKFVPGYIANNLQLALESEIFRLMDCGVAEPNQIDEAIKHGLATRLAILGHLKKIDYTGLQVVHDIHVSGAYSPPTQPTVSKVLQSNVASGNTGVLAGSGFYDYSAATPEHWFKRRDKCLAELKQAIGKITVEL